MIKKGGDMKTKKSDLVNSRTSCSTPKETPRIQEKSFDGKAFKRGTEVNIKFKTKSK